MITLSMSETRRSALEQTLATMPNKSEDADIAMSQAAQLVNERIKQGEPGLYDPSNSADTLVLPLAAMD